MYHDGQINLEDSAMVMMLLGMAGALAVFICLIALDFSWFSLVYYLPALAVSAALLFLGKARLKKKQGGS